MRDILKSIMMCFLNGVANPKKNLHSTISIYSCRYLLEPYRQVMNFEIKKAIEILDSLFLLHFFLVLIISMFVS